MDKRFKIFMKIYQFSKINLSIQTCSGDKVDALL